ncbi:PREDICTED: uncharacterized protein LOC108361850 isoform X2 [Rhagoletis zephyria]|nr:PREDICTED: uncharacterized protein LOC108361850 isoform X2 [Rhagoletis zephyria]
MESQPKRSRASPEQLTAMIDFFVENPGISSGKFQQLHGKMQSQKKWVEMAGKLNAIGGAVKSVDQWHTVWRDLKSRTSIRVRDRKRKHALTGYMPDDQAPMTKLERRVVALIGSSYIDGNESVFENMPLEEDLQLAMEDGDDIDIEGMVPLSEDSIGTDIRFPDIPRNLNRKRAEKESDIQNKFLEIAQKQAEAMKMLAENNVRQVEATLSIAQAMTAIGEGLKACAEVFNKLANTISNL